MISRSGPVEVGHLGVIVPKLRLLLGFSWFDNKVHIKTCQYIPLEHEVVLRQESLTSEGDYSTGTHYFTHVKIRTGDSKKLIPITTIHGKIGECRKQMQSTPWGRFFDGVLVILKK